MNDGVLKVKPRVRESGYATIYINENKLLFDLTSNQLSKKYSYMTLNKDKIKAGESIQV